jgi:NAD(P)-dependent dehydrogenase (short-subunit alcohol dehydrogenase family)
VLINNAGNFFAGFFEELSPAQFDAQLTTNLLGPLNVTRAVLPVMRKQRAGHIVTISSTAGIVGQEFCSAYAASKFGLEGCMESLRFEVEPFGIQTTFVEPGFFRTRPAHEGVHRLRRPLDRGLCRAHRPDPASLGSDERQADQRSRQAHKGPTHGRRPGATITTVGCRRRCGCNRRAEGT